MRHHNIFRAILVGSVGHKIAFTFLLCAFQFGFISYANAQVDAGALQQGLEKQLPMPSPLALPEPTAKEPLRQTQPSQGLIAPFSTHHCTHHSTHHQYIDFSGLERASWEYG